MTPHEYETIHNDLAYKLGNFIVQNVNIYENLTHYRKETGKYDAKKVSGNVVFPVEFFEIRILKTFLRRETKWEEKKFPFIYILESAMEKADKLLR